MRAKVIWELMQNIYYKNSFQLETRVFFSKKMLYLIHTNEELQKPDDIRNYIMSLTNIQSPNRTMISNGKGHPQH